jgi:hypothetical protein
MGLSIAMDFFLHIIILYIAGLLLQEREINTIVGSTSHNVISYRKSEYRYVFLLKQVTAIYLFKGV